MQVVRAFDDPNVVTDEATGQHDPAADIEIINTELVLADLQTVAKRLPRLEKESRANPKLKPEYETLQHVHRLLDSGKPVWSRPDIGLKSLNDLFLLTAKPVIYVFNVDEEGLRDDSEDCRSFLLVAPSPSIFISAKLENELRALDNDDAKELLESYGFTEVGLEQLIHAAYDTLGLQSYLTAGEKEVRAWTIPKAATAPQAAGVIHGDFERGFIAAEVVDYDDLIAAGSLHCCPSRRQSPHRGQNLRDATRRCSRVPVQR